MRPVRQSGNAAVRRRQRAPVGRTGLAPRSAVAQCLQVTDIHGRTVNAHNRTLRASLPRVSVSVVSTTVAFAISRGLSMADIEAATGVGGMDLMDAEARLPDDVLVELWHLLTERHPGVALPLKMARAAPLSFFSGLAHGTQYARDLRSALALLVEHRTLIADRIQLAIEESGSEASLVAWHPLDVRDGGRVAEVGMALATRLIAETLGVTDSLSRVEFSHARVGSLADYHHFFGTDVRFEQSRNALVLRGERLRCAGARGERRAVRLRPATLRAATRPRPAQRLSRRVGSVERGHRSQRRAAASSAPRTPWRGRASACAPRSAWRRCTAPRSRP